MNISVHHVVQVFPAMANWANTHKMTGVGNALKRHYQALLLEYELANPQDVTHQARPIVLPPCMLWKLHAMHVVY